MAATVRSQIIQVNEREWQEGMLPGLRQKRLWADEATKRHAFLTRFAPGAKLPMHKHNGDEILYVIEGAISDEFGVTTAGNMGYRPNGCVHAVESRNGATVFAVVTGGVEPATSRGNAPASQIFHLSELEWHDAPLPGVRHKLVWEDKPSQRRMMLVRFEPGSKLPMHKHVGDELVFVLEGSNADESGELVAGNLNYRPDGCVHSVSSKNGGTALALVRGHTEPV
jgi:anti-sigma factor ChrR (cupin superfamily)